MSLCTAARDKPQRCCATVRRSQRGTGGGGDAAVAEASRGPGKPRTGSTRRPHAGDAAVPHRAEKLPGGRRRAGGRESRRGEHLLNATPRSPFPPFAPAVVAPGATAPSGEDSSTPSGRGEAGGACARVAFPHGEAGGNCPCSPAVRSTGSRGTRRAPLAAALTFRSRHGARRRLQDRRAGAARRAPPLLPSHHRVQRGRPERPAARAEPSSRAPSRLDILESILLHPAAFRNCFIGSKHPGISHTYFSLPAVSS